MFWLVAYLYYVLWEVEDVNLVSAPFGIVLHKTDI